MLSADWRTFVVAATVMAIAPGANQLLSLRNALQQGAADAIVALSGRFSAFLLLVLATSAGMGALLLASEPALTAVKWCGVVYLLYLGGRMLHRSRAPRGEQDRAAERQAAPSPPLRRTRWELTRQEFWVALTNPKALLLFAAFLPQFADRAEGSVALQLLALGLAYIVVESVAALMYAGAGRILAALRLTARLRRLFDRATGATMVGIAGLLAFDRH